MKKPLALLLALSLVLTSAACGKNEKEKAYEDAKKRIDDAVAGITSQSGNNSAGGGNSSAGGENNSAADVFDSAVNNNAQKSNLNLPLAAENVTILLYRSEIEYISDDGTLHFDSVGAGYRHEIWLDNVLSIYNTDQNKVYYAIKQDNTLWAKGSNKEGLVGDGTGVDRKEFVKIADDVASIVSINQNFEYLHLPEPVAYAIKTDKSLWRWGNGIMAPERIADNVVRYLSGNLFLKGDGSVIDTLNLTADTGIINVVDAYYIDQNSVSGDDGNVHLLKNWYTLDSEGRFCKTTVDENNASHQINVSSQEILSDADSIMIYENAVHILKKDGTLWGLGTNTDGQLGDGTKIDRDEPVKIADDVIETGNFGNYNSYRYFIKKDGTPWSWDKYDPTPRQLLSTPVYKVIYIYGTFYVLEENGAFMESKLDGFGGCNQTYYKSPYDGQFEQLDPQPVMLPKTITFG